MFEGLEAAFHRVTQFTTDAPHELRTPVTIIHTPAELARSKPRTEAEYGGALDCILAERERTSRLIEDLMLLARADAQAEEIVRAPMNLTQSLRERRSSKLRTCRPPCRSWTAFQPPPGPPLRSRRLAARSPGSRI